MSEQEIVKYLRKRNELRVSFKDAFVEACNEIIEAIKKEQLKLEVDFKVKAGEIFWLKMGLTNFTTTFDEVILELKKRGRPISCNDQEYLKILFKNMIKKFVEI